MWGRGAEGERERERGERERIPSWFQAVSIERDMGPDPMNCDIMT